MDQQSPLLNGETTINHNNWKRALVLLLLFTISAVGLVSIQNHNVNERVRADFADVVESDKGVVAADDGRCSDIGVSMLRQGGHAVDAAVATALCLGVVDPVSSGIGGGAFMVVRSSSTSNAQAFDMRETAPLAATQDMYEKNHNAKHVGALSIGVPGEIAGLHKAWSQHGRLAWKTLFQPAIKLARNGFVVSPHLASRISEFMDAIISDPGLRQVFAPKGKVLKGGETCYNVELARTLDAIAEDGPQVYYNGSVGEKLVKDVKAAGGILTMEDLRKYEVKVTEAMSINVMGYTIYGMPLPSTGTLGLSMVLNILDSYRSSYVANGDLGLHRLIEAMKHMFAVRMNLGDPAFVNVTEYVNKMLSKSYAKQIQAKIFDKTTFPPEYYMHRWSPLRDDGTSHFNVVDGDRNAVSMTTTVNGPFGARLLSTSTGILFNNEMDDFAVPTEAKPGMLPPAPSNFIQPNKRPLSSMTPLIITKDNQLVGVMGGDGGMRIVPAVIQVFLSHFIYGMSPLAAVQRPRVYHQLIPNIVDYENWTLSDGFDIELKEETRHFLEGRGHQLKAKGYGSVVQLIVHTPGKDVHNLYGELTAVSDPRKDGRPAAV